MACGWSIRLLGTLALAGVILVGLPALAVEQPRASHSELPALSEDRRPWNIKVDPKLLTDALRTGTEVECMVVFREPPVLAHLGVAGAKGESRREWISRTGADLNQEYAPFGLRTVTRYSHLPLARMVVPAALLPALAEDSRVDALTRVRTVNALDAEGDALINARSVQGHGYYGAGVGIAVLDSGVDYNDPELAPPGVKTIKLKDTVNDDDDPMDDAGHGTSCAAIAGGANTGVARGARIVAVKVLDRTGKSAGDSVLRGIDAVLASVSAGNPYNIRIANMSFGGYDADAWPPDAGTCDEVAPDYFRAFQALNDAGVLAVVAAGNGGCTTGVAIPACLSNAIAVGAVYDANIGARSFNSLNCSGGWCSDLATGADQVTCYSDSGEKLDVWAPADCATEPSAQGVTAWCFGGTSAAAPYVTGVAALIDQAVPAATVAQVRTAIRENGRDVTDPRNNVTRKRIDAAAALATLQGGCIAPMPTGYVTADRYWLCSGQSFTLTWPSADRADSYSVEVATDEAFQDAVSSTVSVPSFTYSPKAQTPELLYVRVRANVACGASSGFSNVVSVAYNPTTCSPYGKVYYVSGIGHLHGVAPAFWYSDLAIFKAACDGGTQMRLTFAGTKRTLGPVETSLGTFQQASWSDVLTSLFGLIGEDVGAIMVESSCPLEVLARTYSRVADSCDGKTKTYGQSYEGIEPSDALVSGQVGYLANLRSDSGFRTNVEFVNAGGIEANVEVQFRTEGGIPIGSPLIRGVAPGQRVAVTAALRTGQPTACAEVRVTPPQARIIGFASVIDGASTDPTTIPMLVTGVPSAPPTAARPSAANAVRSAR
jgi:subtilisin family serine protease